MKRIQRSWMYDRVDGGILKPEFVNGVREFIDFAKQHPNCKDSEKIICPCHKCNNKRFLDSEIVREHLYKKGFCHSYYEWICHGEMLNSSQPLVVDQSNSY